MLLQAFPYQVVNKPMLSADSLKHSMHLMQMKIDSLEKIVAKTEIGTSFFYSVIGLQLAVFLFIFGMLGWVGWRSFLKRMEFILEKAEESTAKSLQEHQLSVDQNLIEIKDRLNQTHYEVCRSMFNSCIVDGHELMFGWAMRATVAMIYGSQTI